jgi:hypothetical protein
MREKKKGEMLICGCINPPPESAVNYNGVYFGKADNMDVKARALKGTPLWVEHNGRAKVGHVLQGWTDPKSGSMWALAEIDVKTFGGSVAAAAVKGGCFGEFSLGYTARVREDKERRKIVDNKEIYELSLVTKGARSGCVIAAHTSYL